MKEMTDLDYIELYAKKLNENPKIFNQQKMLIDSQITASQQFFKNAFKNGDFKTQARKYLKSVKLIE